MARLIFLCLLLGYTTSAMADPTQLIQGALTVAAFVNPGFALYYLAASAVVGLYAASDARRKASAAARDAATAAQNAYNASLQDRNVTVLRNDSPWQVVYGSPAPVGGSLVGLFTSGDKDQFKHMVIVFAAHECQAVDEIYIEGDPVGMGARTSDFWCTSGKFFEAGNSRTSTLTTQFTGGVSGFVFPASIGGVVNAEGAGYYPVLIGTGAFSITVSGSAASITITSNPFTGPLTVTFIDNLGGTPRVRVSEHLSPGGVDTADAYLIANSGGQWTAAHKLSGYTYVVLTLDLNFSQFQGSPPNVTAKLRGKKIYDYRSSTTGYSSNPALCIADFLMSIYGFGAAGSQIDTTAAIAAANACDAQGFSCDGMINCDNGRDANLQQLEDSMAGRTHWSGGVWRLMPGAWTTPVMTLDSSYAAGPIDVVQAGNPRTQRYNAARGKYVPANQLGVTADMSPYLVASYITADGTTQYIDATFSMTGTNAMCQKLASIAIEKSRRGLTINFPAHLGAWKLQPGDRVYVSNNEFGFVNKTFRVQDWTHINNAPVGLVLVEDDAAAYTGTFTAADPNVLGSNLVNPWAAPAAPATLTADSGTLRLLKNVDGTINVRAYCQWTAAALRSVLQGGYTQLQWRLTTATDADWISFDLSPDINSTYLDNLQDGVNILIRVRWVTGVGAKGAWNTILHTVVGKTAPPSNVTSLTINGKTLTWAPVADVDLDGYRIKFQYGANLDWGTASQMHVGLVTSSPYTFVTVPPGSITIMVRAVDTSGNESNSSAYVVTNLGNSLVANVVEIYDFYAKGWPGTYTNASILGGLLTATQSDPFYSADAGTFFKQDSANFYSSNYDAMNWVSGGYTPSLAAAGSNMTLAWSIVGNAYSVQYRKTGPLPFFADDASYFYAADASTFYSGAGAWATWPGSLVADNQEYQFQVSTAAGVVGGVLSAFTATVDVPDKTQKINNVALLAAGSRLTAAAGLFNVIQNVQLTLQGGSTAVSLEITDKSTALGPLIIAKNSAGTGVAATVDAFLQGY